MAEEFIPSNISEFASKSFWNKAFEKSNKPFDWYGDWHDMEQIISHYLKPSYKILVVGCGNSSFSQQLYDYGYKNIVNIDYSDTLIEKMKKKYSYCTEMTFLTMDATKMTFEDESFDFVIDKACLDAMYAKEDKETETMIEQMFSEVKRVLKSTGYYLCISLAQKHVLNIYLNNFSSWYNRYYLLFPKLDNSAPQPYLLLSSPTTLIYTQSVYSTSFLNSLKQGFETKHMIKQRDNQGEKEPDKKQHHYCTFDPSFAFRRRSDMLYRQQYKYKGKYMNTCDLSTAFTKATQNHGNRHLLLTLGNGDIFEDTLCIQDPKKPSYTVRVYDVLGRNKMRYLKKLSIIFVPIGRELEYSFNNPNGLEDIGMQIDVDRLIMVYIHRDIISMESMQDELTPYVLMLYPNNCDKNIPFMKVSDELGEKTEVAHVKSSLSGDIFVEDITVEGIHKRRLIFGNNRNAIQTEYLFDLEKKKKGNKKTTKKVMNFKDICFDIYKVMLSLVYIHQSSLSTEEIEDINNNKFLIMGLGGGSLCSFIYTYLLNNTQKDIQQKHNFIQVCDEHSKEFIEEHQETLISCVEIDNSIASVAKDHFQLCPSSIFIQDAYPFVQNLPSTSIYQYIIMDIDNKDISKGLTFPPSQFLSREFLTIVQSHLSNIGALLVNISSHNPTIYNAVVCIFKQVFENVELFNTEDLNKCIYASGKKLSWTSQEEMIKKYGDIMTSISIDNVLGQIQH